MKSKWDSRAMAFLSLAMVLVLGACGSGSDGDDSSGDSTGAAQDTSDTGQDGGSEETRQYVAAASGVPGIGNLATQLLWDELRRQGIDVEVQYLSSGENVIQAIARGDADFAFHVSPAITAAAVMEGVPLKIASGWVRNEFVMASTTDLESIDDLEGARVGIHAETGGSASLTNGLIEEYDLEDVNVLVVPNSPARAEAIAQGELDAATIDLESALALVDRDPSKYQILVQYSEAFGNIENGGFTATEDFYAENPDDVQEIITTYVETVRKMHDDPDWTATQATRFYGLNYEDELDNLEQLVGTYLERNLWDPNGGLTEESGQRTIEFFANYGSAPEAAAEDWEQFFDFSYVQATLEELGDYGG